jgi:hypothetical protein
MKVDSWAREALKQRGVFILDSGKFKVEFHKGKFQEVADLPTAIRQQKHIIDQQKEEQKENEEIGKMMAQFNILVLSLSNMTVAELTDKKYDNVMRKLFDIIQIMSRKTNKLRIEGYNKLLKVYKMLEKKNIPAANTASMAALSRMRQRWLVNAKVIDKSSIRLEALKRLSV